MGAVQDPNCLGQGVSSRGQNIDFMVHHHEVERVFRGDIHPPVIIFLQIIKWLFSLFEELLILIELQTFLIQNESRRVVNVNLRPILRKGTKS